MPTSALGAEFFNPLHNQQSSVLEEKAGVQWNKMAKGPNKVIEAKLPPSVTPDPRFINHLYASFPSY